jgi:hypothetical protein
VPGLQRSFQLEKAVRQAGLLPGEVGGGRHHHRGQELARQLKHGGGLTPRPNEGQAGRLCQLQGIQKLHVKKRFLSPQKLTKHRF